jgi:hypothetical protein
VAFNPQQKLASRELLRRGDISWLLHPEQRKLLDWLDERRREIAVRAHLRPAPTRSIRSWLTDCRAKT